VLSGLKELSTPLRNTPNARNQHYKDLPEEIVDILHLQNELKKTINS